MSAKVALGIFWDIENCPVPLTKSASSVAKSLRDFIAGAHPECGYAKEFFCVCDTRKVDQRLLEGLDKNGVVVVHVNAAAKNAADDKLQELIDMYVDKYGTNGSAVLCIITGDINFAKPVRNARRKDLDVLLIHGRNCSPDLKNLVNESYLYEDIIKGADNAPKLDNQLKPVYLEVSNLPTQEIPARILGRLALLSANCGGKPESLSQGKAFIRFGCKDDAQRCQQRIDGENVFSHKIKVKLSDGDPKVVKQIAPPFVKQISVDQNSGPTAAKLKNKTLSEQNLSKNATKNQIDLTQIPKPSEEGDDCRSVIIGLTFKKGTDLIKLVQDMIIKWNDKKVKPDLIKFVQGGKLHKENGKLGDTLHVLAISPEANKLLVFRSKRYLKDSGIKWYFKLQKKNEVSKVQNNVKPVVGAEKKADHSVDVECMSVIKGLETKKDDNVAKMVRKIVYSWNDKSVQPNYVKTVERDRKFADKDGVILLFVTAMTAENSNALLAAANRRLKPKDGFQWNAYQRKRNASKDTDTESNISDGFEVIPPPKAPTIQKLDIPVTDDMMSVITGLETKKGQVVAKVVRKVLTDWKNPKLNGNMIRSVDRFPDFPDTDGKIPLLVTAVSPQACMALITGAEHHLDPSSGIFWNHFKSDPSFRVSQPISCLGVSSAVFPLNGQNSSNGTASQLQTKPICVKQESVVNEAAVRPKFPLLPVNLIQENGFLIDGPQPTIPYIPPIHKQVFGESPSKQSTSVANTATALVYPSILSTATTRLMAELVSPHVSSAQRVHVSVPPDSKRGDSDSNLLKSLVSGFESLFKSSKSSPNKSLPKRLDADLTDLKLNSSNRICYPPVPFKKSIPGGLTEGFALCIRGRLNTSADCFAINFIVNDSDIAFHFNVRRPHSLVVRNSSSAARGWGPEERDAPTFPFVVGQFFDIIIQVKRNKYVVVVNGQHFCDYEHRMPFNSVKGLSVTGDISIESVCTS